MKIAGTFLFLAVLLPATALASTSVEIGNHPVAGLEFESKGLAISIGAEFHRTSYDQQFVVDVGPDSSSLGRIRQSSTVLTPTIRIRRYWNHAEAIQPFIAASVSKGIPISIHQFAPPGYDYREAVDNYSGSMLAGFRCRLQERLRLSGAAGVNVEWLTRQLLRGTDIYSRFDISMQWRL